MHLKGSTNNTLGNRMASGYELRSYKLRSYKYADYAIVKHYLGCLPCEGGLHLEIRPTVISIKLI
jgi:hypothetical protein